MWSGNDENVTGKTSGGSNNKVRLIFTETVCLAMMSKISQMSRTEVRDYTWTKVSSFATQSSNVASFTIHLRT